MEKCTNESCHNYQETSETNCRTSWRDFSKCWWIRNASAAKPDPMPTGNGSTVEHPSHYTVFPIEVIDMIRLILGPKGFKSYCLGNIVKYRFRAGLKGDPIEDIKKADQYLKFLNEGTDG